MISEALFRRFYPDESHDGAKSFYSWIRESTHPDSIVLNLGAGPATGNPVRVLRGEVGRVFGADIDPEVMGNEELDEARIIEDGKLSFPGEMFDVVYADFVLEHVKEPIPFLEEVIRVLKDGGFFFFRTPNKYHYVPIGSRLTPHWFHVLIANRLRGLPPEAHDPYPTYYRMNSRADLSRQVEAAGFASTELRYFEGEPSYLKFSTIPFLLGVAYERLVNSYSFFDGMKVNIFGRLQR